jgi:hypothetical protein
MARFNESELDSILNRRGYGIHGGIKGGFKRRSNADKISGEGEVPDAEPSIGHEPLRSQEAAFKYSGRCIVRVKVFRKRLADPDGNCPKWHIDAIRMSRLIRDDSAKEVDYYFDGQEKVQTEAEERIEITLQYTEAWWE